MSAGKDLQMNRYILCFASALASSLALAGNTAVSASAGSVAGIDTTTSGSSTWSGLKGPAQTALMNYEVRLAGGSTSNTSEFKFINNSGVFGAHIFNGVHKSDAFSSVNVSGASTITTSGTAPTYYQASWTSTTHVDPLAPGGAFSGTYDPWQVRYKDISALGTPDLGTADLYYQTSLLGGFSSPSGFDLNPGQIGSYEFSVSLTTATGIINFFDIDVNSDETVDVEFTNNPNFEVYLLGSNANDENLTPTQRTSDRQLITSAGDIETALLDVLNPDGSLASNLTFGIIYRGFVLPPTNNPDEVLFSWNTDTRVNTEAVPEPASMAALGLGVLAVLRRRRK
ncbi:PEP-CTERM sorting domain-containing protein [bacterium]|nr:MAG: PEP-CTERM sorting domain-containing protein [bacterium]